MPTNSKNNFFIDIDYYQECKYNQNAYGDCVKYERYPFEGRLIGTLSDGLGSGVKANILATMTSTMICKFLAEGRDILKAAEIMMESLPVCKVRNISYATFSIVDIRSNGNAKVIEEGNPEFLFIRDNKVQTLKPEIYTSKKYKNRLLNIYNFNIALNDRLIFCSDGVSQSGLGGGVYKLGWRRSGLIDFVHELLEKEQTISSRNISRAIVQSALEKDKFLAKDDISVLSLYARNPRKLLIFTGPPFHKDRDKEYATYFINFQGKKALLGGTTTHIISRELGIEVKSDKRISIGKLPAPATMEGIDLVTEGALTLTVVSDYLEQGEITDDGAGQLVSLMLDSDHIEFLVGSKMNEAHYDPDLTIELGIRKNIVRRIVNILEKKYAKEVSLKFI